MSIEYTKLPNGLRVITDTVPSVESVAVGIWADVGTRHEEMKDNGVAHMVEHMMFKGTPTRSAAQIAEQVEDVGGQVNAYTSREVTSYHMHLLKDDFSLAMDVLSDIVQRPTMPEEEVERERGVILQEIGMTHDTPDDVIFDHYQQTAYPDQAIGAPILGRVDIIEKMTRDTLMDYVFRFYTPSRLVVSASGNISHEQVIKQTEALFSDLPEDQKSQQSAANYNGGEFREHKDLEQAHLVLGFDGVSRHDDQFYAVAVLATVLGGGMSSRLFQEVREKRGLVYSVFSHHATYQDDGQFMIYAGTGPDLLPELIPVLCGEIIKSFDQFTDQEMNRAKAQIKADLLMGRESMMRRANQQAKHLIHFDDVISLEDKIKKLDQVSANDVANLAKQIFSSSPTLAALGPLGQLESFDNIKDRLAA